MTNQTLSPFASQTRETKTDPSGVAGAMGWLSETIELVTSGQGRFVSESQVSAEQLKQKVPLQEIGPQGLEKTGSLTGFQTPSTETSEAQRIEFLRASLKNYDVVAEARHIEDMVRLEMIGISDEQLAEEGDFNNTSITNRSIVRSVANKMWVFFKRVAAKLAGQKEQTAVSITETRNTDKFQVGENGLLMGGERSGGGHWSTTPG